MKCQDPSTHGSKVTEDIKSVPNDKPKAICPTDVFKVGGIKIPGETY